MNISGESYDEIIKKATEAKNLEVESKKKSRANAIKAKIAIIVKEVNELTASLETKEDLELALSELGDKLKIETELDFGDNFIDLFFSLI